MGLVSSGPAWSIWLYCRELPAPVQKLPDLTRDFLNAIRNPLQPDKHCRVQSGTFWEPSGPGAPGSSPGPSIYHLLCTRLRVRSGSLSPSSCARALGSIPGLRFLERSGLEVPRCATPPCTSTSLDDQIWALHVTLIAGRALVFTS